MNNKINVGVCVIASVFGFVAGGLVSKLRNKRKDMSEIDKMIEEIDIFEES